MKQSKSLKFILKKIGIYFLTKSIGILDLTAMQFDQPLVSALVPAYNAEAFIGDTLDSIINQTYTNIEVLVVDDGSQDRTAEIVESIAQKDSRVTLLRQSNAGVAAARNLAIQKSTGDYIAPIDADDIWYPQKLEKQMQCMLTADPSVELIYTWTASVTEKGLLDGGYTNYLVQGEVYLALLCKNFVGNASVPLIRRTCIERVGGYNVQLKANNAQGCEDWDLMLRVAEHYQFRVVPEILVGYRGVPGSMSSNIKSMGKSYALILEDAKQKYPEIPVYIYQWGKTNFYFYLLGLSYVNGNYLNVIFWTYKIVSLDFAALLSLVLYRMFIMSILKLIAKPITSLVWTDHYSWSKFRQRFKPADTKLTIADINSKINDVQKPVWKPYDQIVLQRWLRVMQMCKLVSP